MNSKTTKIKNKQQIDTNFVEAFRDLGSDFKKTSKDLVKDSAGDFWKQMFGDLKTQEGRETSKGDLVEGEEISFGKKNKALRDLEEKEAGLADIAPGLDYRREIIETDKRICHEDEKVIESKIQEILTELRQIVSKSQELEIQYRQVIVEQRIEKPGKYHLNFFEWILSIIKNAHAKIEDSQTWLSAFKNKKAKQGYWQMFKKHGTTFALSNERVVAQQTG